MKYKTCTKCRIRLPASEFHRSQHRPDGLYPWCKACKREAAKADYAKNRELNSQKCHAYYLRHRQTILDRVSTYQQTSRGRDVNRRAAVKWEASSRGKEFHRAWSAAHREERSANTAVYRAIKAGTLVRPETCSRCQKRCKPHGHHHKGYEKPRRLDVTWLCPKCHYATRT